MTTEVEKQKQGILGYITETRLELKKVTWPGKNVLTKSTMLILFVVAFYTFYIAGLDIVFANLFKFLRV